MRALVAEKLGNPAEADPSKNPLHLTNDRETPKLVDENSVLISVTAASLNFADALQIMGKYQERPTLPFIPGSEVSGSILQVGHRVSRFKPGDAVCAVVQTGGFAEQVVCNQHAVFLLPPGCDQASAAAVPIAYGTAHLGLVHRAGIKKGQVLLVLGAAGGVGAAAVQLGKLLGATVIAVARGEAKAAFLRSLGADHVIDTRPFPSGRGPLHSALSALLSTTHLRGVDVILDPVGGDQLLDAVRSAKWGAHVVIIGFASGQIASVPSNIALVKNLTLHGLYWGSYMQRQPETLRGSLQQLLEWVAAGEVKVPVWRAFDLAQAKDAFGALLNRDVMGKIIFTVSDQAEHSELRAKL